MIQKHKMQNVETLREIKPKAASANGAGNPTSTEASRGLMIKADEKLSEKIPLSKGTILMLSAGPAILMLVFSYGGSLLGWAREDQSTKERLIQTGVDMQRMVESQERIENKLADFDKRLREQERFQDRMGAARTVLEAQKSEEK